MKRNFKDYLGEVWYDVWRNGGNPDAVDDERVRDQFDGYEYPEDAAHRELRRQRNSATGKDERWRNADGVV